MKNLYCLIGVLSLFLISCSNDDSSQGELITKMVYKGENVSWDYRDYNFNFIYDGNQRLIRIDRDGVTTREFTYAADLITEIKYYSFSNLNPVPDLNYVISFQYDSENRLTQASSKNSAGDLLYKYNFNYTNENQAEFIIRAYGRLGNNDIYSTGTINYESNTNNILNVVQYFYGAYLAEDGIAYPSGDLVHELIYDTKKHPCSNIKGYKELAFFNYFKSEGTIFTSNFGSTNNLLTVNYNPLNQPQNVTTYPLWLFNYGSTFPSKANKVGNDNFNIHFYY